jgi:hypothetical protein
VAQDREQYSGVHTRHGIGACQTQAILVKRRAVIIVVARGAWTDTRDTKLILEYIGLMFGQIESESCIRQNACLQEVTLSRDATVDPAVIPY